MIIVDIIGTNNGVISCSSANNSIASCSVQNNKLYISPKKDGEAVITVKESKIGVSADYKVKVQYNYECVEGTLTNDSKYGSICLTPGYAQEVKTCIRYGEPSVFPDMCIDRDDSMITENITITCRVDNEREGCKYNCTLTERNCEEYKTTQEYACPSGWSKYVGENENLQCYKSANVIR